MRRGKLLLVVLLVLSMMTGCSDKENEIRATWISYIDYTEILWGKNEEEYRAEVAQMMKNLAEIKINTVYVHASAFTDAYYPSEIYPTAQYITGKIADELSFDPFGILLEEAKSSGLSVEAWINPLRSLTQKQMQGVPDYNILKQWIQKQDSSLVFFKDRWYLNPASEEAQNTVVAVVCELLEKYDLDGIHLDDYFYPDGVSDEFDSIDYQKYGNGRTLAQFRKDNVNQLIKKISQAIKKADRNCRFTISPAGNIQYSSESIYGDVAVWIENEWIDCVVPQIYFGYEHEVLPYDQCLKQWEVLVEGTSVDLVPGLAVYKINTVDDYAKSGSHEWIDSSHILSQQIADARKAKNYRGYALYSYHAIFYPENENTEKVWNEINEIIDLIIE